MGANASSKSLPFDENEEGKSCRAVGVWNCKVQIEYPEGSTAQSHHQLLGTSVKHSSVRVCRSLWNGCQWP